MKRFHFPLDRVRRYRHLQVEAAAASFDSRLTRLRQIDEQIGMLDREGARTAEAVRASLAVNREVRPVELAAYPDYRSLLARGRQDLFRQRQQAMEAAELARAALIEARRAHEVLERARAVASDRWQADFAREQEAAAGELFLNKWERRRSGE